MDDQGVDAPQRHGLHVHEVGREDTAGLGGQELPLGRAGPAGRWIDPGVVQDLPHCRRRDPVTQLDELTSHASATPVGFARRHADHQLADRGCRRRPCPGRRWLA
jgi:hypothetical protein